MAQRSVPPKRGAKKRKNLTQRQSGLQSRSRSGFPSARCWRAPASFWPCWPCLPVWERRGFLLSGVKKSAVRFAGKLGLFFVSPVFWAFICFGGGRGGGVGVVWGGGVGPAAMVLEAERGPAVGGLFRRRSKWRSRKAEEAGGTGGWLVFDLVVRREVGEEFVVLAFLSLLGGFAKRRGGACRI